MTPDTQTGSPVPANSGDPPPRRWWPRWLASPAALALVIVLVDAVKPVTVDDTAYLAYARHIADHPSDPYGFQFYWYTVPEPAFEILCPPVVPYWLAGGIRLVGESPPLLKLWLYPVILLFTWSVRELLRRFAGRHTNGFLAALALSPAVLPGVNLFLDIPALALGLAAVALLIRGTARNSWRDVLVSGLAAGAAMQTKYTALLIPVAMGWYGFNHRRSGAFGRARVAIVVALLVFGGWELMLVSKYGRSHFAYHAIEQASANAEDKADPVEQFLVTKSTLIPPLVGYLGCLGIGVGLAAFGSVGISKTVITILAVVWCSGFMWITWAPPKWCHLYPGGQYDPDDPVTLFWQGSGTLILAGLVACSARLLIRVKNGVRLRKRPDALFLVGWLVLELAGYFVLSPFPAARRVIGLVIIGGLVAARASTVVARIRPERRAGWCQIGVPVVAGFAVAAIDTLDAYPEKVCAERAAQAVADRPASATVWFAGHWGFQYYCERAGMKQFVPGKSIVKPGDFLVLPIHPDEIGFHRPHMATLLHPPPEAVVVLEEIVWHDRVFAQTVPNYYGGGIPVANRQYPRLRVVVYRVIK